MEAKLPLSFLFFSLFLLIINNSCTKSDKSKPSEPTQSNVGKISLLSSRDNSLTVTVDFSYDTTAPVTEKGLCFGTTSQPNLTDGKHIITDSSRTVTLTITGLQSNSKYYVRPYIVEASGVLYGGEAAFNTQVDDEISDPAVNIYISGENSRTLICLNAATGMTKWIDTLGGEVFSSPIYYKGNIFVGCEDGYLYAFDSTGIFKWKADTKQPIGFESPVAGNDMVYITSSSGLSAYHIKDGSLAWSSSVEGSYQIILKDGTLYYNGYILTALDPQTGREKWHYETYGNTPPAVLNGKVYVCGRSAFNPSLNVLNASDGSVVWTDADYFLFNDATRVILGNGKVYVPLPGKTGAFDTTTGSYQFNISGPISVLYDTLGIARTFTSVYTFSALTGVSVGSIPTYATASGITPVNHTMYYGSDLHETVTPQQISSAGTIYAFDMETQTWKWMTNFPTGFRFATPCVVTRSGKVYRGGDVF